MARPELGEGASYLIASPEDMMKLKTIELFQFPNRLSECCHVGVMTVRLPHDLFDNELRVATDVKLLNPKLDGDAQTVDECLVFCHIVGCAEVYSNHVEEPVFLRGDQNYASPGPVESERGIEIYALVLLGDPGGGC
jgi:hypothetical protein